MPVSARTFLFTKVLFDAAVSQILRQCLAVATYRPFRLSEVAARCLSSGKRGAQLNATAQGVGRRVRSNLRSVGRSEKPPCPPMVERSKRKRLGDCQNRFSPIKTVKDGLRISLTALRNIRRRNWLTYSYASRSSVCLHESTEVSLCIAE